MNELSKLKEEYMTLKKQIEELYNKQINLYKDMIADEVLVEQRKNEYEELTNQIENLRNMQINLYKNMIAEESISYKHI